MKIERKDIRKLKQSDRIEFMLERQIVKEAEPKKYITFELIGGLAYNLILLVLLLFILAMQFEGETRLNLLLATSTMIILTKNILILFTIGYIIELPILIYRYNKFIEFKKEVYESYFKRGKK